MDPIKGILFGFVLAVLCVGCVPGGNSPDPWESEVIANNGVGQPDQVSEDEAIVRQGTTANGRDTEDKVSAGAGSGVGGGELPTNVTRCQTNRLGADRYQVICQVEFRFLELCSNSEASVILAETWAGGAPGQVSSWSTYPVSEGTPEQYMVPCLGFEYEGDATPQWVRFQLASSEAGFKGWLFSLPPTQPAVGPVRPVGIGSSGPTSGE